MRHPHTLRSHESLTDDDLTPRGGGPRGGRGPGRGPRGGRPGPGGAVSYTHLTLPTKA